MPESDLLIRIDAAREELSRIGDSVASLLLHHSARCDVCSFEAEAVTDDWALVLHANGAVAVICPECGDEDGPKIPEPEDQVLH